MWVWAGLAVVVKRLRAMAPGLLLAALAEFEVWAQVAMAHWLLVLLVAVASGAQVQRQCLRALGAAVRLRAVNWLALGAFVVYFVHHQQNQKQRLGCQA